MLFNIGSKDFKNEYIEAMNSVEQGILKNMTAEEYLTNLYTNPDANKALEEANIGALSDFIAVHSFIPSELSSDNSRTNSQTINHEQNSITNTTTISQEYDL